jgi:hypothetical protein
MRLITPRILDEAFENLPQTIDEAYDNMLDRVSTVDKTEARKLLRIIISAPKPLPLGRASDDPGRP